jgi:hypothetical protein
MEMPAITHIFEPDARFRATLQMERPLPFGGR